MEDEPPYIALFVRDQRRLKKEESTIEIREGHLESLRAEFGRLDSVPPGRFERWIKSRGAISTQRSYFDSAKAFYRWGVKAFPELDDPTAGITLPRAEPKRKPISDIEVKRAISATQDSVRGTVMRCWLTLAAYQGLRCAEISRLRSEDIEWEPVPLLRVGQIRATRASSNLQPPTLAALTMTRLPAHGRLFPSESAADVSQKIQRQLSGLGIAANASSLVWWYRKQRDLFGSDFWLGTSSPVFDVPAEETLDSNEQRIVTALEQQVPSAALSYRQAIRDLAAERLSFRGTANDLRSAVWDVLQQLGPNTEVMAEPDFEFEKGENAPTHKQRASYILRSRRRETKQSAGRAIDVIEEAVSALTRLVYVQTSISSHVEQQRGAVRQVKMYADAVLADIFEIHRSD